MTPAARIRALFEEHGRPAGLSLRRLAELPLAAGAFPPEALERAEDSLREELAWEALLDPVDPWPRPDPPGVAAVQEKLRRLFDRYAGKQGIPRRRWRKILGVSGLVVHDAARTWAARRCRDALLRTGERGWPVAYPVHEADACGDLLWRAREDLSREDVLAVLDRLHVAEEDLTARTWRTPLEELAEEGEA